MTDVATEIAEIEALQRDDNVAYWKDPQMPQRYGELIAAQEAGTAAPAGPSANAQRIAEIEADMAGHRVGSAFEGIDTTDLDSSFEGLSDSAQGYAYAVLADPSKREALIESMPVETLEELIHFVNAMPDDEQAALERALLL